jgi:hypothetical protein
MGFSGAIRLIFGTPQLSHYMFADGGQGCISPISMTQFFLRWCDTSFEKVLTSTPPRLLIHQIGLDVVPSNLAGKR